MKQTHSSTFIKQQAENHMSSQLIKTNLCSECLSIYTEKSVQEHLNFVHSVETVFCLMSENFLTDKSKILYVMQFLIEELKDA